jgi:hypothetical protein
MCSNEFSEHFKIKMRKKIKINYAIKAYRFGMHPSAPMWQQ